MGINIINQTNEQECGVCVITSLHNHFFKDPVEKQEVLEQSHISDTGMTIFDFEALASSLGLECESYETKYADFINLKINGYFVLLLATPSGSNNHYVIARKHKKYIEIYDSCSLEMNKLSYAELKKIFLNVIILVRKKATKTFKKVFGNTKTLLMFDLKFLLINLGLSVLILLTSIACASFLNYVIDLAIGKSSINNLITICFIFVLFYFSNDLLTYVSNLYMSKHIKSYMLLFTNKILGSLENKKPDFLFKVDKNWIFKVDECVYNISNFSVVEINKFITNIIFVITCVCVIGSLQHYLLIFVAAYLVIELIFFLFAYRKKQEVFLNIVRSENSNAMHYKNLINSLKNEVWLEKRQEIIKQIKNNYSSIYKSYSDVLLFKNNSTLTKSLLKSFCEVCLIAMMSYLIIKTDKLTIGKLIFAISAFALFRNSTNEMFSYFITKIEFDVYWQVYKDLTSVSNYSSNKEFRIKEKIKSLKIQTNDLIIKLELNKDNVVLQPIVKLLSEAKQVFVNNDKVNLTQEFVNKLIVVDQQSKPNIELLIKYIEKEPRIFAQYIKYFAIDFNSLDHNFYNGIIINLLTLLITKNKVIFIDDILHFIKPKDRLVVKQLINKIKRYNTVFITGKEDND